MPDLNRRALVSSLAVPAIAHAAPVGSPERITSATQKVLAGKTTGVMLAAQRGRILWSGVVGEPAAPVQPPPRNALFDALSIGKTFTACAVLRLADMGLVDPNKPIRAYLPELGEPLADIRIRHALNNDTGLPDYLEGEDTTPKSNRQALAEVAALTPSRKAGTGYHYSNVNFILLGLMIERVTGQPFEAAMQRLVFEPAGLVSTGFFSSELTRARPVATGYVDGKPMGSPTVWPNTWNLLGSAGIATTVDDLYRLNRAFLTGAALSPLSRARLLMAGAPTYGRGPYVGPDNIDISYGAGLYHWVDRQGRHVHFHAGDGDYGFNAVMFWRAEDDLFLSLMLNSRWTAQPLDRSPMMAALLQAAG